ncbi:hypothetical protein DL98DRAFT_267827 [Cadophora sp. DSE1049]|nr:hypothetical protein DL98DRAFT_267827 [Cadophora sp. DSE1049]
MDECWISSCQLQQLSGPRPNIRDKLVSRFTIYRQNLVPILRVSTHIHPNPAGRYATLEPLPGTSPPRLIATPHLTLAVHSTHVSTNLALRHSRCEKGNSFELLDEDCDPMHAGYVAWPRRACYIVFHHLLWRSDWAASEVPIPTFSRYRDMDCINETSFLALLFILHPIFS